MTLSKDELRAYFKKIGSKGGKTTSERMTRVERTKRARKGAIAKWKKAAKKGGTQ